MFNLFPTHSAHKPPNHKLSKNHKISPDTNPQKTHTNITHKTPEEPVPSVLPLPKKHTRPGHAGIADHPAEKKKRETKTLDMQ